jgi:hypothetical protein
MFIPFSAHSLNYCLLAHMVKRWNVNPRDCLPSRMPSLSCNDDKVSKQYDARPSQRHNNWSYRPSRRRYGRSHTPSIVNKMKSQIKSLERVESYDFSSQNWLNLICINLYLKRLVEDKHFCRILNHHMINLDRKIDKNATEI